MPDAQGRNPGEPGYSWFTDPVRRMQLIDEQRKNMKQGTGVKSNAPPNQMLQPGAKPAPTMSLLDALKPAGKRDK